MPKRRSSLVLSVVLACLFCFLLVPTAAQDSEGKNVVVINYARKTEYEKDSSSGDELIVLTGNVSLTIRSGKGRTEVTASTVRYNRRTNMLYALGNVHLLHFGENEKQEATANSLLFNTSTLEGIFDNSRIVQYGAEDSSIPSQSTLVASSKLMGKNSSGVMAFKHATITFCDEDDPHWKIRATRAWMLPGGEFAFFNAALYVGHIPVLYLPAFYYPKDEPFFNPVLGFDQRRGYFVQTTTYLFGRKPLSVYETDDEDGSFSFAHPSTLKDQVREGIMLHNLDTDYTGNTTDFLKLTADYYTNLGGMVGLEGAYAPSKYIKSMSGYIRLGFSNTVFYRNDEFSRYSFMNERYKDASDLLGWDVPFRYSADFEMTVSDPFSLSISLPVYTDPYFAVDYGERKEYMDWMGFLTSSSEAGDDDKDTNKSDRKVSEYSWNITGSYSAKLPEAVQPYISTLSIDTVSSAIVFSSTARKDPVFLQEPLDYRMHSPERERFYPSLVTPFRFGATLAGTIYSYKTPTAEDAAEEEADESEHDDDENAGEEEEPEIVEKSIFSKSELPELDAFQGLSAVEVPRLSYELGYSIAPRYLRQYTYTADSVDEDYDFDWSSVYSSYYEFTSPVSLTSSIAYGGTFLSMRNSLTFEPFIQHHPDLDGYTSESSKNSVLVSDYERKKLDLYETNRLSFRPFMLDPVFKNTGIDWDTRVNIVRTKFIGDADNPEWEYLTTDFKDHESIAQNTITAHLDARESENLSQTLTLASSLPPREGEHDVSLKLQFPHVQMNFATGVSRTDTEDETIWKDKPFQQALQVSLFDGLEFNESFNYNLEEDHRDSLKFSLNYKGLQLGYTMQRAYGYDYDFETYKWKSRDKMEFLPYSLTAAYISPKKTFHYWKNRISWAPGLETSVVWDCIRPSKSYFMFIPSITFRINEFLDITFSSESRNSVIFRYIQDNTRYGSVIGGETNPLTDLIDSFAFWDSSLEARKRSGFKLKNLKITVEHDLHDWNFNSTFIFAPKLISEGTAKPYYSYEPYFSFAITWRPMSGFRTQIVDDYGDMQLNP